MSVRSRKNTKAASGRSTSIRGVGGCKEARTRAHHQGDYEPGDEKDDPILGVDRDTLLYRVRKVLRQIEIRKKDLLEYIEEIDKEAKSAKRMRRAYGPYGPMAAAGPMGHSLATATPYMGYDYMSYPQQYEIAQAEFGPRHVAKKELKHMRSLQQMLRALEEQVRCGIPLEGREYSDPEDRDDDDGYDLFGVARLVLEYPDLDRLIAAFESSQY